MLEDCLIKLKIRERGTGVQKKLFCMQDDDISMFERVYYTWKIVGLLNLGNEVQRYIQNTVNSNE